MINFKSVLSFVAKLSGRERVIFYATVTVVILVLLDRVILTPIISRISYLNETIRVQEEGIEQSLLIVNQEKRIEDETNRYATFLSQSQNEEKDTTVFLQEVETIAKKSSIYLTDIKPSGKGVKGDATQYFLRLSFEAQMEQVFNFFYNVSNYEQLLKIEEYQIRPKSAGSSVIICSMSISKSIILK